LEVLVVIQIYVIVIALEMLQVETLILEVYWVN